MQPKIRPKGVGIPAIVDLNLYHNRIGDAGAEAFAAALRINKNIRSLHLSQNMITVTGFKALFAVVKNQASGANIEQLWLDKNNFDEESKKILPYYHQMRTLLDKNEKRGLRRRGIKSEL